MYVEMGRVGVKRVVAAPSPSPDGSTPSAVPLLSTLQPAGAVTEKVNGAFRSGCSKLAKTRRASAGSYWVYRYTSPSSGSTKRCSPSPVRLYAQRASTTSSFSPASPSRAIRVPSKTAAGSSSRPLSVTATTSGATRSAKDAAPGSAQRKRTVVVERKVRGPGPVSAPTADRRSRATSYASTDSSLARSRASSRVRFSPGT